MVLDLWTLYEQTEDGCNKKCDTCPLMSKHTKMCLHEENKKWQEWTNKRHEEFGELLRMYEG